MKALSICAVLALACAAAGFAQQTRSVSGRVVDNRSGDTPVHSFSRLRLG